jgi:hypothetical protein
MRDLLAYDCPHMESPRYLNANSLPVRVYGRRRLLMLFDQFADAFGVRRRGNMVENSRRFLFEDNLAFEEHGR